MGLSVEAIQGLRMLGLLVEPRLEEALESVRRDPYVADAMADVAGVDAPLPATLPAVAYTVPSPKLAALAVNLLGVEEGATVLVAPARAAYVAAVLAEYGCDVVLYDPDELVDPFSDVEVVRELPTATFDRVLVLDPEPRTIETMAGCVETGGALLRIRDQASGQITRYDLFERLERARLDDTHVGSRWASCARDLVALECSQNRAIHGDPLGEAEAEVDDAVRSLFDPIMARETGAHTLAGRILFHLGYLAQAPGDLGGALALYEASADAWETAEALTFAGWVHSIQGQPMRAVERCKDAIRADPSLGNPYNDIGAYLIEMDEPEEALPWLDLAMEAPRYDSRWFPHLNKGRALLLLGEHEAAREEFEAVLELNPNEPTARAMVDRLKG